MVHDIKLFDVLFFGSLAVGSLEFARPGTFKKTLIDPPLKAVRKLALTPLGKRVVKSKKLAIGAGILPVEIALIIAGETTPVFSFPKEELIIPGLSRAPVTTLVITGGVVAALSLGTAALGVGLGPATIPVASSLALGIVLELLIA